MVKALLVSSSVTVMLCNIPYDAKVSLCKTFAVGKILAIHGKTFAVAQTVSNLWENFHGWCLVRPPFAKAFSRGRYTD